MCFREASSAEIENNDNVRLQMSAEDAKSEFQVVSTNKLLLRSTARAGVFHFFPVSFDTGYFSCLSICVSSIVKEFKFKPTSLVSELQTLSPKLLQPIDPSRPIEADSAK